MNMIYQIIYNGERFDIVVTPDGDNFFYQVVCDGNIEGSDSDTNFTTILNAIYSAIDEICIGDESSKITLKRDIKLDEILNYEARH